MASRTMTLAPWQVSPPPAHDGTTKRAPYATHRHAAAPPPTPAACRPPYKMSPPQRAAAAPKETSSSPDDSNEMLWVRLVGLPFSATEADVMEFIGGFAISNADQVIFPPTRNGRGPDRVLIRMVSTAEAARATEALNGRGMKGRYIEARQVTLRHVLREVRTRVFAMNADTSPEECGGNLPMAMSQSVTLVGLPFNCTPQDIFGFLSGLRVRGVHQCRGGRDDVCVVELHDVVEATRAVKRRHRQFMGGRYIEVYAARPVDMRCGCALACVMVPVAPLQQPQQSLSSSLGLTTTTMPAPSRKPTTPPPPLGSPTFEAQEESLKAGEEDNSTTDGSRTESPPTVLPQQKQPRFSHNPYALPDVEESDEEEGDSNHETCSNNSLDKNSNYDTNHHHTPHYCTDDVLPHGQLRCVYGRTCWACQGGTSVSSGGILDETW